jgi:lincosamide nucleotidyltransferase A/C/D/E
MNTPENIEPKMTAQDVLEVVSLFEQNHIEVIIDGGWGVDALLGEQTRQHADLDIAMPHQYSALSRQLLEARGYHDEPRPDTSDCNFVMGDDYGHLVDFHTYTFDEEGNLVFGIAYPPDSLNGTGSISGCPVRCITPEWLVKFHAGYAFDENDYRDVKALCRRFSLELPAVYLLFENTKGITDEV